jgi:hypothetical protein
MENIASVAGDISLGDDILSGVTAIAAFINEPERRTYYLLENRHIPAGKVGAIWTASKRRLREHYDRITQGAADAPQLPPHPRISRRRSANTSRGPHTSSR